MIGGSKDIKKLIGSFLEQNGLRDAYYLEILKNNLDKIFKNKITNDLDLKTLQKGHLVIFSDSSAWKEELKLRRSELIIKFNSILEKDIIKSIEVK